VTTLRYERLQPLVDTSVEPQEGQIVAWSATRGAWERRDAGGGTVPDATETLKGKVELATSGEAIPGVVVQGNDGRLYDARTPLSHSHSEYQATTEKGQANGYASLAADGKVPAAQLPVSGGGNGYVINVMAASLATVADGATLYFGCLAGLAPQTTAQLARIYIPKAGTIVAAEIWARAATAGGAENWSAYIRKNNTTDTLIQTIAVGAATRRWTNTALAVAVALGDFIEIKLVNPTWVTNPATLALGGVLYVE
jgi:hypothetical protein